MDKRDKIKDCYVNGAVQTGEAAGDTFVNYYAPNNTVLIGGSGDTLKWVGSIPEDIIHNRVLSAGEAAYIYNQTKGR